MSVCSQIEKYFSQSIPNNGNIDTRINHWGGMQSTFVTSNAPIPSDDWFSCRNTHDPDIQCITLTDGYNKHFYIDADKANSNGVIIRARNAGPNAKISCIKLF